MAAPLNYAEAYQRALEQEYPYVHYFGALFNVANNSRYRWDGARTILLPSLTTTGRVDSNRDAITLATRNYENNWVPKTLTNEREWSTLVDPMDIDETNMTATIANITQVFNQTQKFPEEDAYLVSKIYADWLAAGATADNTALTTANVLQMFDQYSAAMDDARVPISGRILYVTSEVNMLLKDNDRVSRQSIVDNATGAVRREVTMLDDTEVLKVPKEMMKTVYDFTEGWEVGTGAAQINMFMVHPSAIISPIKYTFSKVDPPAAMTKGKYVYYEQSYGDVFILEQKKAAIQFNVSA